MYDMGLGVKQSHSEAMRWFKLAAEQGHRNAGTNLKLKLDVHSSTLDAENDD